MWSKVAQLTDRLSADEKSSLEQLDQGPMRPNIPFRHAERLITLGLAELSLGQLDLTIAGKQSMVVCQRQSKDRPPGRSEISPP